MIPSTLQRIIEHFGLTVAYYGFRPNQAVSLRELESAVKTRPGAGMILSAAQVAYAIGGMGDEDFAGTPCNIAIDMLDLTRNTRRAREGYRHDDAHDAADHAIAVAALVVTDRMSPELLTALLCLVKA